MLRPDVAAPLRSPKVTVKELIFILKCQEIKTSDPCFLFEESMDTSTQAAPTE